MKQTHTAIKTWYMIAVKVSGSMPVDFQNVLDPLTTLTYVADVTQRISLGTSVIDMFFQNPVKFTLGPQGASIEEDLEKMIVVIQQDYTKVKGSRIM